MAEEAIAKEAMVEVESVNPNQVSNEWSWLLSGRLMPNSNRLHAVLWMHSPREGDLASCEFDRSSVGDQIQGWYHTHPTGIKSYQSETDIATLEAWCFTLGRPLISIIEGADRTRGWIWVDEDNFFEVAVQRLGNGIRCTPLDTKLNIEDSVRSRPSKVAG